jgi:hypothetical protein
MEGSLRALHKILGDIAAERGLRLAYDTHYDAGNLELSWWQEKLRHRVDFQPFPDAPMQVTHLVDTYPLLPRLVLWCRRHIPMFSVLPKTEWQSIGTMSQPYSSENVEQLLEGSLPGELTPQVQHP